MGTLTIAVDLAKNVFEIAIAGPAGTIRERKRLSRPQFENFWINRPSSRVVMEACASSHFWARYLIGRGFDVVLLAATIARTGTKTEPPRLRLLPKSRTSLPT